MVPFPLQDLGRRLSLNFEVWEAGQAQLLRKEGGWDARGSGSGHLFQAALVLKKSLFSFSAYDCDFFNKGKPITPK